MRLMLFVLLLAPTLLWGQQRLCLAGHVTDEQGQPLQDVRIELHETHEGAISDANGRWTIPDVRRAHYHLHLELPGYYSHEQDLHLEDSTATDTLFLFLVLKETKLELPSVRVEADPVKIEARRQSLNLQHLDQRYLDRNRNTNLLQTIAYTPGLSYMNTGTGIAKPVVRGLAFNRVAVVQHHIQQEGQQWGQDHGLEVDGYSVGSVQILKGPAALMYGPQAIGGVIQLLPPAEPKENTLQAEVQGGYQSLNDSYTHSTSLAIHRGPWLGSLRLSTQDYGDYRVPAEQFSYNRYLLPIYDRQLKNTAGLERNISAMVGRHGNWGYTHLNVSHFHQQAGIFVGAMGTPRALSLTPDGNTRNIALPYQRIRHLKVVSNSNLILGKDWLEIDLAYQQNHRQEHSLPHAHGRPTGSDLALQLVLHTATVQARLHQHWLPGKQGVLGISAQYQQNQASGFEFLLPNYQTRQAGLYLIQQWERGDKLFVNAGLRADYGNVQTDAYRSVFTKAGRTDSTSQSGLALSRDFANVAGSAGLSWHPTDRYNLKLNLGSYFRFPQTYELAANGVHHGSFRHEQGNADLKTERGLQVDLGLHYQRKRLQLSITPFASYFLNYLYLSPTARYSPLPDAQQLYAYTQDPALLYGGEAQADCHLGPMHLGMGYTYLRGQNLGDDLPLPFMPPNRLVADAEYTFGIKKKWLTEPYLRLACQLVGNQERVVRNELTTPGYALWSLAAGLRQQWGRLRLEWSLTVQNLGDVVYYHHLSRYRFLGLPEPGRNVLLSLRIPLQWQLKPDKHAH